MPSDSEMFNIPVVFNNKETGQIQEEEFSVSRRATVGDLLKDLKERFPGNYVSLNNAATELQEDDLIDEVFEAEEDVLTAVEKKNDEVRFGGIRKFVNNTDHLVILMDKKKRPIFLPSQEKKKDHYFTMNALDFHPRVVVFRKTEEERQGEKVWKGQKYKIPKDKNVVSIKFDQDRVYKITEEGNEEDLDKVGDEVSKIEPVFYRPVGRDFQVEFYNLDEKNLHVITGSKLFFESIEILAGEKKMIKLKSDFFKKGQFRFGVASAGRVLNTVTGKREFSATMFELCPEGKMVKINKTSAGFTATMEKPDGAESELVQKGAKTFNESERLCKKELLLWLKQGLEAIVAAGVEGAVGGATEAGVGSALGN